MTVDKQATGTAKIKIEDISYKNYEKLARFINDRSRIIGRKRTGLSAKAQRLLAREVKRARHLGLLSFKSRL